MTHKKGSTCKVEPYLCLPMLLSPYTPSSLSPLLFYLPY